MAKYTDEQIKKAVKHCLESKFEDFCEECPFYDDADACENQLPLLLELINRQEAEKAELQRENCELKSKIERVRVEVAELNSNLILLRNDYELCRSGYEEYKEKVAILNDKLIAAYKLLKTAKSETVKEFWNSRPEYLNEQCEGKEEYNKGWNACLDEFFEIRNNLLKETEDESNG